MKDTNITFKLSEEEKQRIKDVARQKDIPVSQFIRELIKQYFNNEEVTI